MVITITIITWTLRTPYPPYPPCSLYLLLLSIPLLLHLEKI